MKNGLYHKWSPEEIEEIARLLQENTPQDVADMLGVKVSKIYNLRTRYLRNHDLIKSNQCGKPKLFVNGFFYAERQHFNFALGMFEYN